MENLKKNRSAGKGKKKKVEPIKNLKDIGLIKRMLKEKPRDLALFVVGINTALRASDLVRIKTEQVKHLKGGIEEGEDIEIKEKKTGKMKRVTLSPACVRVILKLLDTPIFKDEWEQPKYLFHSRKGRGAEPLTVQSVHQFIMLPKNWTTW